jgi:hypothetical protein
VSPASTRIRSRRKAISDTAQKKPPTSGAAARGAFDSDAIFDMNNADYYLFREWEREFDAYAAAGNEGRN